MRVTKDYKTEAEREATIAEMVAKGFNLAEDQLHFDGNHLVFEKDLAAEIDDLKARVKKLEKK